MTSNGLPLAELVRAFEACTLPSADWTHAAHLSIALWYLHIHPREEATRLIRIGIQRYNAVNGKGLAYHETITLAWIEVVSRFLAEQDRHATATDLVERLFFSDAARAAWLPPDLADLR